MEYMSTKAATCVAVSGVYRRGTSKARKPPGPPLHTTCCFKRRGVASPEIPTTETKEPQAHL